MLVPLVIVTFIGALFVDMLARYVRNNYEIEWPAPTIAPENAMALEIAATLRRVAGNLNCK